MQNRLLTIMFLDVQGYTKRTAQATREEMTRYVEEIRAFVDKHIARFQGTLVKTMGDGFLVSFESPTNAVQCGLEMQKQIRLKNATLPNPNHYTHFRIGINTGEVSIDEKGDLFGDPVNIAARIESFAEPGEVFISEATYLAMNRNEVGAVDLGPQSFKNATREIRIYKVSAEREARKAGGTKSPAASQTAPPPATGRQAWRPLIVGLAILLAGGALFLVYKRWVARAVRLATERPAVGGAPNAARREPSAPSEMLVGEPSPGMETASRVAALPAMPPGEPHPGERPLPPGIGAPLPGQGPGRLPEPSPMGPPPAGGHGRWPPTAFPSGFPPADRSPGPPPGDQRPWPSPPGPTPDETPPFPPPQGTPPPSSGEGPGPWPPDNTGSGRDFPAVVLVRFPGANRPPPVQELLDRVDQAAAQRNFAEAAELVGQAAAVGRRLGWEFSSLDLARMAKIMMQAGYPKKAATLLEKAIELAPGDQPQLRHLLIGILERLERRVPGKAGPGRPGRPPLWGSRMGPGER